ncbi:winged helix-turn-helix domain-containing protein [Nocardiopsis sp. NRRL B-16309]|uniref:GntR family transcriptional regulator n=1 Tax=Nocardiopsis sp. NRRL B-16309 TaxID=1519494 RepID=UPI0006AE31DA|nr:winged helix-turn-helix domain-containing protein [Nocardiopsis sp. NRRL B-16309]KOX11848.1 hypothetical protein ADL05_23105 [Nocardiopsis sp. NRRL B-16309]
MPTTQQPYLRVLEALREALEQGRLAPGDKYPSINALVKDHGVAHVTARRALQKLQEEGRAHPQQGVGWFVTEPGAAEPTVEERLRDMEARLAVVEGQLKDLRSREGTSP